MSVSVLCPNLRCKVILNVPESMRGQVIRCGQCGTHLKVPRACEAAAAKGAAEGELADKPDTPKPKKKMGRPRKEIAEEKEREERKLAKVEWKKRGEEYAPAIEEIVRWPFETMAERRGAFWKLKDTEAHKLSCAVGVILAKWLPYWLEKYEEEIALGFTLGACLFSRVREDRKRNAQRGTRDNGSTAERKDDAPPQTAQPAA